MPFYAICLYGHMAISSKNGHMAIWPYDHMAWNVANMGISRNSYKNAAIWWRNQVDSTFWQEMRANLVRWRIFLCIFSDFPLYIQKMMATPHTCSKTHQNFFGGSWGIDTATCNSTEGTKHFGAFWDTLIISSNCTPGVGWLPRECKAREPLGLL